MWKYAKWKKKYCQKWAKIDKNKPKREQRLKSLAIAAGTGPRRLSGHSDG